MYGRSGRLWSPLLHLLGFKMLSPSRDLSVTCTSTHTVRRPALQHREALIMTSQLHVKSANIQQLRHMSGVTHLPEVQRIDLMSVLGALKSKNSQTATAVQHIASDSPTNGHHSPSFTNGSACHLNSNDSAPALIETEIGESPFPVLCLVLATDGVW